MSIRNTVLLALLAVGVLGVVFFQEKIPFFAGEKRVPGSCVLRFSSDEVTAMEIRKGNEFLRFEKSGSGWKLGPNPKDQASGEEIAKILREAKGMKIIDMIPAEEFEGVVKSKSFGLASPKTSFRLETPSGVFEVFFGREGAGEDRMFVRTGKSKDTYLVSDSLYRLLMRAADEFRDPRLVALSEERIERVLLVRPDGEIELGRKGLNWEIRRPLQAATDAGKVKKLLDLVLGAKIHQFVTEGGMVGKGGRGESLGEIQVWEEGETVPVVLKVRAGESPDFYLVEHSSRKVGAVVSASNFVVLRLPLDELRSRQLIDLNPDMLDRFSVKIGETQWKFFREANGWQVANATKNSAATQVGELDISAFFEKLNGLRVQEFLIGSIGKTTASPIAEVRFSSWLSENTPEATQGEHLVAALEFFSSGEGKGTLVRVNDVPGFCVISAGVVDDLRAWAETLSAPAGEKKPAGQ